jgi:hypothetical protein
MMGCHAHANVKKARIVYLQNEDMGAIRLSVERATVLSFPTKPEKVVLGNRDHFSIEFIENDVVITPLNATAHSNLFVYLFGRRFGFDLVASHGDGDEIVIVRDIPNTNEKTRPKSKNP